MYERRKKREGRRVVPINDSGPREVLPIEELLMGQGGDELEERNGGK